VSAWAMRQAGEEPAGCSRVRGKGSLRKLFRFLEGIECGGDCPLEKGVEAVLKHHTGRGAVVLLSDFLTTGDLKRSFNALSSAGLVVFGVQILGPGEIHPDVSEDLRFVDSETGTILDVSASPHLLEIYQAYRTSHASEIAALLRQRSGRFLTVSAQDRLDDTLFDLLPRKGWVR